MSFTVGDVLPALSRGPLTTRQLVEYAGASLDFNRIHYDDPFAKAGGHPSVIAHGMLSMAFFGQMAHVAARHLGPAAHIAQLTARFKAVTYPGDEVTVTGEVTAVRPDAVELKMIARRSDGTVTLEGSATVVVGT